MSSIRSISSEDLSKQLQEDPIENGNIEKIDLKSSEETGFIALCKKIWNWVCDFFHWIAVSFGLIDQEVESNSLKSNRISSSSLGSASSTTSKWPDCFFGEEDEFDTGYDASIFNKTTNPNDLGPLDQSRLGFSMIENEKSDDEDMDSSRSDPMESSFQQETTRLTDLLGQSNNGDLKKDLSTLRAEIRGSLASLGLDESLAPIYTELQQKISQLIVKYPDNELFILLAEEALVCQLGINEEGGYKFTEPKGDDDFVRAFSLVYAMAVTDESLEKAKKLIEDQFFDRAVPEELKEIFEKRKEAMIQEVSKAFKDR